MSEIRVTFRCKLPAEANDDEIREWLEFNLHTNSMLQKNSLSDFDLDAVSNSWIDFQRIP